MDKPQKFTKKPVDIEAIRFEGGAKNATPVIDWVLRGGGTARYHEEVLETEDGETVVADAEHIAIDTLEGTMRASVGDWVVRGVKGEYYPVRADIFRQTYSRNFS